MKYLLYIFSFLFFSAYGQEVTFKFEVKDAMTNVELDSVSIQVKAAVNKILFKQLIVSQEQLTLELKRSKEIQILAKKEGYYTYDTILNVSTLERSIRKDKNIEILVYLKYRGQISEEYDVAANYKPNVAFSSERISVSDYIMINKNELILLVYPKNLSSGSELIYFKEGKIEHSRKAPENSMKLMNDYRNRVYLRGRDKDYLIEDIDRLNLSKVSREQLDHYVAPILDTLADKQMYFTNYKSHYPAFDFFKIKLKDTTNALLHHIEDLEMMEHYRAEYKWADVRTKLWAWDMEAETGIDREVWVGANVFSNSIYYEAPYSEFFLIKDEVFIFDFYKDLMFKYDAESGEVKDSVAISFHKEERKTGWQRAMFYDPIAHKIYTIYDDAGYMDLYEIDLTTGMRKEKFTLFYRYVENIQIYNDEVFYIYRPYESLQKKYLYQEGFNDPKRNLKGQERFGNKN